MEKEKLSYGSIGFLYQMINLIPLKNIDISLNLSQIAKAIEAQRLFYIEQVEKIGTDNKLLEELNKKKAKVTLTKENKKILREELPQVYAKGIVSGLNGVDLVLEINELIKE